ncbi:MAG TPA: cytochrome c [Allosphingosinicella sp.]|nr:cytochrome c [Allosphingosinicella sp.]
MTLVACAQNRPPASASVRMSRADVVGIRQAGMRVAEGDFMMIRLAAEKGADIRRFERPARSLAQWAAALPGMFPAGTGPGTANTRARVEIWSNRADFEQKAADFRAAVTRMADAAAANNMAEGARQWDAAWRSCNACHDSYRAQPANAPAAATSAPHRR